MSGVELVGRLKARFGQDIPGIVLTGDAADETRREITRAGAHYLLKPVDADHLHRMIERHVDQRHESRVEARPGEAPGGQSGRPIVAVVDDDAATRDALRALLEAWAYEVETFGTCEAFLARDRPERPACLLVDVGMPGMGGLELQERLNAQGADIPVVVITGRKDVPLAVQAMRAGAIDFLQKPFANETLSGALERALAQRTESADRAEAGRRLERLTAREREVMELLVAGCANKEVARRLGISPRTAENHRARIMEKTDAGSLAELVRLAMAAGLEIGAVSHPD